MTTTTADAPAPKRRLSSTILKNVTSNWAAILVNIALSFVIAPVTVAALGNAYYGIWTLLMQFTGYLWLFDFGVRESVIKYVAQYQASNQPEKIESTVRTAVSMYTVVALGVFLATCGLALALPYAFNIPPDTVRAARITAVLSGATIAQYFVFNVYVGVLMGVQKFYLMARIGMIFGIIRAGVMYVLMSAGYGLITLAMIQFIVAIVSNIIVYHLALREMPFVGYRLVKPRREEAVKLLNYGKYVLIANIGDKLIFATDSIIIGMFLPISALTYYALGGTLIEQFRSFITSMASIFNPLSSSLEARNEPKSLAAVYMTGAKVAILLGLPVCIGFMVLGERFISIWMGPEYGPLAGRVLLVLAAGHLIGLPYYTISGVLYGLGQHQILARMRIVEAVMNLTLSVVLIKTIGLVGVALGTVIPHVVIVLGVLPAFVPKLLPVSRREYYLSTYVWPFVAALPFCAACWAIETRVQPETIPTFLLSVALAMPAYLVPCWFLTLSSMEQTHVRHVVRRMQPA
jgi:O-antigen/teichoic acid export membrane protein